MASSISSRRSSFFLAIFSYALLVGLVLYIRQHPSPGFGGLTNIAIVTLIWVFFAFLVYGWLYGRNRVPLATHADRLYVTGMTVKTLVYTESASPCSRYLN